MSNYLPLIIRDILTNTGWSENEIAVYSALIEKGGMGLTDISEETQIPIPTVQYALKKLTMKKMLSKSMLNGRPVYSVSNIDQLRKWVKGYTKKFQRHEEEVTKFIDQYDFNPNIYTPKVRFFEGVKGVKQSYRKMLNECEGKEIKAMFSVQENVESFLEKFFFDEFIPNRIKKGIKLNNLAIESPEAMRYKKIDKKELRETKLIPKFFFPSVDTEISFYDDCMHCMSSNEKGSFSMILKDKELISVLKAIFGMLWSFAEKIRFYEGNEGIKESYRQMLKECTDKEIKSFFSLVKCNNNDLEAFFDNEYVKNRVKNGIKTLNIALKCDKTIEYKKKDEKELRETKLIEKKNFPITNTEINLYGNYMHCMSFNKEQSFALIIRDKSMVSILTAVFDLLWEKTK